jgi:hypothetical protein
MNVHLNLHEAHFPLRMRAIAQRHSLEKPSRARDGCTFI